jgi:hypothetical protein
MTESSKQLVEPSEELNFPVFLEDMAPPSVRTMDEIDSWIEHDYEIFFNREKYTEEKIKLTVGTIFSL